MAGPPFTGTSQIDEADSFPKYTVPKTKTGFSATQASRVPSGDQASECTSRTPVM